MEHSDHWFLNLLYEGEHCEVRHKAGGVGWWILHYIIIQLTPHLGFSVTDYIKYYVYLCYFSLNYLSLQQL
jgi:hypothetical protein